MAGEHNHNLPEEDKLLQYLDGTLPPQEAHEVEKKMEGDPFMAAAMEGLGHVADKENLPLIIHQLNHNLRKKTAVRYRKKKLSLQPQWELYFSVLLLLLIIILVYFFLHHKR